MVLSQNPLTDNFGILVLLSLPIFDQWGTLLAFILCRIKSKSNPKMSCPYNKGNLAWQNQFLKVHICEIQVSHIKVHYSNLKKNHTRGGKCITKNLPQWHLGLIYESWLKGIPLMLSHWEAFQPVISFPSNSKIKAFFFLNNKIWFYSQIIISVFFFYTDQFFSIPENTSFWSFSRKSNGKRLSLGFVKTETNNYIYQ